MLKHGIPGNLDMVNSWIIFWTPRTLDMASSWIYSKLNNKLKMLRTSRLGCIVALGIAPDVLAPQTGLCMALAIINCWYAASWHPWTDMTLARFAILCVIMFTVKFGQKHPDSVVETSSLSSVEVPDVWYKLSIPESTIDYCYLSALQLESITYTCQKHESMLPSGERAGYLIGKFSPP